MKTRARIACMVIHGLLACSHTACAFEHDSELIATAGGEGATDIQSRVDFHVHFPGVVHHVLHVAISMFGRLNFVRVGHASRNVLTVKWATSCEFGIDGCQLQFVIIAIIPS
jgi:hypothetical protein